MALKLPAENLESRCIMHYSSSNKILLVGEGDFSFSTCLAQAFGSAKNMTATSLDTLGEVMKYSEARENLKILSELGCQIIHGVDALYMNRHPALEGHKFDRIVFNFPHAGFLYREPDQRQIILHQAVVSGFFKSAGEMLREGGQVHVTHKTSHPFNKWCIERLANDCGLRLFNNPSFYIFHYPGYNNKKGAGVNFDKSFPIGQCQTFIFNWYGNVDSCLIKILKFKRMYLN
ncbi:unnamed protein product [Rhodiola kirilowii]